jgi:endonuclease/exonuclease/phosphatase (EEP) superfamily protein YafD
MNAGIKHIINLVGKIITIVIAVITVIAAYGGKVNPAYSALPSVLTLAFPLILALDVAVAIAWIAFMKWRTALIAVLAIIISWPTVKVISPVNIFSHHYTDKEEETRFKVLTFNVMNFGLYDGTQKEANPSMRYILDQDPDIVLLQEASLSNEYNTLNSMKPLLNEMDKKFPYRSHGYHDLVIMSKHPYKVFEDTTMKIGFGSRDDLFGEYHFYAKAFDMVISGHKLRLLNVHLRSIGLTESDKKLYMGLTKLEDVDNRSQLRAVKHSLLSKLGEAFRKRANQARAIRKIINQSPANLILCGDFNDTPGSYTYRLIRGDDMRDAYSECGLGPIATYNQNRFYFKIDQVLYRGDMQATEIHRDKAGDSDHYPQVATFIWKENK